MPEITLPKKLRPLVEKKKRFKIVIGGRGCYPHDTEYLSDCGWRKISDYDGGKVLVCDPYSGESKFEKPEFVRMVCDEFVRFKNAKVDFTTSLNHNHILRNEKTGKLHELKTHEIADKHESLARGCKSKLIRTFNYDGSGIDISDDYLRLKVAVFADGHFPKGATTKCRVNLKRERKIERLEKLLINAEVEYTKGFWANGYTVFHFRMDNRDKKYPIEWYKASKEQLKIIAEECLKWDGSIVERSDRVPAKSFTTTSKQCADFIQFVYHATGIKADITTVHSDKYTHGVCYDVIISEHKTETCISIDTKSQSTTTVERYKDDWMYCFTTSTGFFPVRQKDRVYVSGNSGKSQSIGDICVMDAQTQGIKTMCFREYQNSIDDSVLSLLASEIHRLGVQGFECQQSKILYEGDEAFKFRGLARNPEGIKSTHGFKRFWVEEAQTISFESLKNLTPTLREEESEIWMSANPRSAADPFSQRFIKPFEKQLYRDGYYEDDLHLVILINYVDNPFFPAVLEQERAYDEEHLSRPLYEHIWLGKFYDEVAGSIIPVEWFDAAIDAHEKLGFKPEGAVIAAYDPSDLGPDSKGFALRHGSVVLDVCENVDGDVNEGTDWALRKSMQAGADWFVWDCDGMGVSLKQQVSTALNGKPIKYVMYRGSQEPENPDQIYEDDMGKAKSNKESFFNRRSQYYWKLRDRFYNTYRAVVKGEYKNPDDMISLSSGIDCIDQLRAEVCRIPSKPNNNGKIQIMSKIDMAKKPYQLPSPNMADSLMMSMFAPSAQVEAVEIKFEGW